jgi:hypothetical protein
MYTHFKRGLVIALVLYKLLYRRCARMATNVGHWCFDLALYHGRPGTVEWDVEAQFADGRISVREIDDGQYRVNYLTFRIVNRWPIRDGRKPSPAVLFDIRAQAVALGIAVINVEWFTQTVRRIPYPLLALEQLPTEMPRWEQRLRHWLNGPVVSDRTCDHDLQREMARTIIRRVT